MQLMVPDGKLRCIGGSSTTVIIGFDCRAVDEAFVSLKDIEE